MEPFLQSQWILFLTVNFKSLVGHRHALHKLPASLDYLEKHDFSSFSIAFLTFSTHREAASLVADFCARLTRAAQFLLLLFLF